MKGISAVVATYNRSKELERLLDSMLANKCEALEVIIVDQNTNNLIDGLIAQYRDRLEINHLKMTIANQSMARNLGAVKAKYDVVCFPDDDCWFDDHTLNGVLKHFREHSSTDLLVIGWNQGRKPGRLSYPDRLTKADIFSFRAAGYVTYVLFFNRSIFQSIGGFNEALGLGRYIGGGEDTEITFRTASKDLYIAYDTSLTVNHKYTEMSSRDLPSIRARERAMGFLYATYKVPFYVTLRGFVAPLVKMVIGLPAKKSRNYYNTFLARAEGYAYARKTRNEPLNNKNNIAQTITNS